MCPRAAMRSTSTPSRLNAMTSESQSKSCGSGRVSGPTTMPHCDRLSATRQGPSDSPDRRVSLTSNAGATPPTAARAIAAVTDLPRSSRSITKHNSFSMPQRWIAAMFNSSSEGMMRLSSTKPNGRMPLPNESRDLPDVSPTFQPPNDSPRVHQRSRTSSWMASASSIDSLPFSAVVSNGAPVDARQKRSNNIA